MPECGTATTTSGSAGWAGAAYQDFLALWKDDDRDIPILRQAKTEWKELTANREPVPARRCILGILHSPYAILEHQARVASAARAASLCAGHAQQLGGASPPANLMEVKA